ncbi:MAG: di-heme oxidoredictase family protein [Woeseiaceae bacterium]
MRHNSGKSCVPCLCVIFTCLTGTANAQLTDLTQTPNPINAGIAKSLEEQIGTGQGDEYTAGSSIYMINRDPARAVQRGRQLFQRAFTRNQGMGPRVTNDSIGDITVNRAFGAGLANSCAACHGRPRGAAGFGGDVVTRPDSRDAPHLFGAGLIEMIGDEMTQDLRNIRERAQQWSRWLKGPITLPLESKGTRFGRITAWPDGRVDTSKVEGVDEDLRVRPFFAQGGAFALREFIVGAFKDEMGLESADPILCAATELQNPAGATSPSGMVFDPSLDMIVRPAVCELGIDGDEDGVVNEIDPALVDYLEFYLLNYFKPALGRQSGRTHQGRRLLQQIGCTDCHTPNLKIEEDRRIANVETRYDQNKGIFNHLFATATTSFESVDDGEALPKLLPKRRSFVVRDLYADFKRHDLGPAFHERDYDGSTVTEFMTEPLWGVGTTAPYGHDGRSMNLEEVILRHGGEAEESRNGFAALNDNNRRKVIEFLDTLMLFPPADTASNLNPGVPGSNDPQDPSQHGSIDLSVLFTDAYEGAE